jgi:hypothetical protein
MSPKTARHYRENPTLPSQRNQPRAYRTRPDPFAEVWTEVEAKLKAEPRLTAKTLFAWLQRQHPKRFPNSQRRSFERRVRDWRAKHGPNKTIFFRQVHHAGEIAASDFTCLNALKVTIAGEPFEHLASHAVSGSVAALRRDGSADERAVSAGERRCGVVARAVQNRCGSGTFAAWQS